VTRFKKIIFSAFILGISCTAPAATSDSSVSPSVDKKDSVSSKTDKQDNKKEDDSKAESSTPSSPRHWSGDISPRHWTGSNAQFGLVMDTGNSSDTNFSSALNLKFHAAPWLNIFQVSAQYSSAEGGVTKEKYFAMDQLNYSFSKTRKSFVFMNSNFTEDKFSPYNYQVIGSAGYGRDIVKTKNFLLNVQAGPGVRNNKVRVTEETDTNLILTTASYLNWKIAKSVVLSEQLTYDVGPPYNYLKSVTALTNKIIGNLAIQVSYTVEYYSDIPLDSTNTKNLDTTTNITLVYNF